MWYVIQHERYYDDLERTRYPLAVAIDDDDLVGDLADDLEARGYTVIQRSMAGLRLWVKVDNEKAGTIVTLLAGKYKCSVAGIYDNTSTLISPEET